MRNSKGSNDHAIMVAQSPNANSNLWRAPRRIKRSAVKVLNPLLEDLCHQLDKEQDEEQVLFFRNQFVQMIESIKRMKRGLPPDTEQDEEFGT
jgi:HPt (histidine-containing phosphotransfer) domain-containing protein